MFNNIAHFAHIQASIAEFGAIFEEI